MVRDLNQYTGWRIALCLRRGHAGLPMPVPQILFGSTSDLKNNLTIFKSLFPASDLYAVGSSAGTGLLVRYLGEQGEDTPLKLRLRCVRAITRKLVLKMSTLLQQMMTKKLFKYFIYPYQNTWSQIASLESFISNQFGRI